MRVLLLRLLLCLLFVASTFGTAWGRVAFFNLFNETYRTTGTILSSCRVCHQNSDGSGPPNAYGVAFRDAGADAAALKEIEPLDSDRDTFSTLAEINGRSFPGDFASTPPSSVSGQMPAPLSGQSLFVVRGDLFPITTTDPVSSVPFGFGLMSLGVDQFRLHLGLPPFSEPVDLYLGLVAPSLLGPEVFLLTPQGLLPLSVAGLTPWVSDSAAALDTVLIPDTTICCPPAQCPSGTVPMNVGLRGSQQVPPVATPGTGTADLSLDMTTRQLTGTVTFSGLTSNALAAYFRRAPAGANGPVFLDVLEGRLGATTGTLSVRAGTVLTATQVEAMRNNELYISVETVNNAAGELRGQVIFPAPLCLPRGTYTFLLAAAPAGSFNTFYGWASDFTVGPRDLALHLRDMAPNIAPLQTMEVRVVSNANVLTGKAILDPLPSADFDLRMPLAVPQGAHRIDFFSDLNLSRTYNSPPVDQAWRLIAAPTGTVDLTFAHTTAFTDINFPPVTEKGAFTLTLGSMADYVRRLMEFRVIKAETGETVGYYRLDAVAANNLSVAIPGIIESGVGYRVDFYADVNDSKSYDAPPADHAWRLSGTGGPQGLTLNFVRNSSFTDIGF